MAPYKGKKTSSRPSDIPRVIEFEMSTTPLTLSPPGLCTVESSIFKRPREQEPPPSPSLTWPSSAPDSNQHMTIDPPPITKEEFDELFRPSKKSILLSLKEIERKPNKLDDEETLACLARVSFSFLSQASQSDNLRRLKVSSTSYIDNLLSSLADLLPRVPSPPPPASIPPDQSPPRKKTKASAPSPPSVLPTCLSAPAPKKAVEAPTLSKRPDPKAAPPVSVAKPTRKRRQGKHTVHGTSRRGIILTLPAGSHFTAASFTPEVLQELNSHIATDLKPSDFLTITHALDGKGIFLASNRVPYSSEIAFVLKHVRRILDTPSVHAAPPSSTSYLKILDVPVSMPTESKDWVSPTRAVIFKALKLSPTGLLLKSTIVHTPRLMRVSPHSDSCIAWVDISDSVSGLMAKRLIGQFISVNGINCRIAGAKPHSGTILCTRCMRWGHHSTQCRSLGMRCSLCGGPHSKANHHSMVNAMRVDLRQCVNCTAAKREKRSHSSLDKSACPFWKHRYDREWIRKQFKCG